MRGHSLRAALAVSACVAIAACGSDGPPGAAAIEGGGAAAPTGGAAGAGGGQAGGAGTGSGGSGMATGGGGLGGTGVGGSIGVGGSATGGSASGGSGGTPGVPGLRFIGRTDTSQSGETRYAWSGSGVAFRFEGTEASVTLKDSGRFHTLIVDGQASVLATTSGEQTYSLASGLAPGVHEVQLYRRTEASFGNTSFVSLDLGGGTLLPPPPAPARRIEVIGDSITCGYGNEGPDEFCDFSADTENHYLTYGAIAARAVNAELHTIAWSGKGIIYNYGDNKDDPLPSLYDQILPYSSSLLWDFGWQPDVVVINLGTNDYSTGDDPPAALFTDEYEKFLIHLRGKYPSATLLALVPTLLGGSDLTKARMTIEAAVGRRTGSGDANVEAFAMSFTQTGWGCDYHPSAATHASMGDALTAKLKSLKGW